MRMRLIAPMVLVCLLAIIPVVHGATDTAGYFRYPDIHGNTVVFCAEADIWTAPATGGVARRITRHAGNEYFPNFSPDGLMIAFTGAYDGNFDVYVIPAEGGEPRRLTWHPVSDEVIGWMPDGKHVIFRSQRNDPNREWHLFTVDLTGGEPQELPLGWAARIDVDAETGRWAFNRWSRERRNWKRYRGGWATDIWVGHPDREDYKQITDFDGMDAFPMWHDGRVYFVSDQGGTVNIWSINPDGSDRQRHTEFDRWDARWPAMGPDGRIAFTLAADIHVFDPATGSEAKVNVSLPSDRLLSRSRYPNPGRYLDWFDLSPEGDRLALVTRGEIFSVPVKDGVTIPVTRGTGARERAVRYGPKGEKLLYLTDEPKEEELRIIDAWGRGEPEVVKPAAEGIWHFAPAWSPDGKWIAWGDDSYGLFIMPAEGGKPKLVDRSDSWFIFDYSWSPDGRWLAYTKILPTEYSTILIYDTKEKKTHTVTGPYTSDGDPTWDPEGRYLYFVSSRAANPFLGSTDFENVELKNDKLYMVLLRKDVKNPLANLAGLPPEDEEKKEGKEEKEGEKEEKEKEGKEKKEPPKPVEIDVEGLSDRIVELPGDRGSYGGLGASKSHLFYISVPLKGMSEQPGLFQESGPEYTLMFFDLEKKKAKPFVEGISRYSITTKGDKIAVMKQHGEIYVVGTASPPGEAIAESKVDLSDVVVELDPRDEWSQIYYESWRQMREYYWDERMGGVDWKAMRDQYAELLPRVSSRSDLSDLIGQLYSEMSTSHTYIFGGDPGVQAERRSIGMLGADLERHSGAFKVVKIYRGDPADRVRSPLEEPGVGISEGDYILAVNRVSFDRDRPFLAHTENLAGKEVLLTVNDKPEMEGSREVVVVPMGSETDLRYSDWVRENREYVSRKTDGKIGYIHLPDMMTSGLVEFNTWFYPQMDKEGMIVDVRWNGGGMVSEMIVRRLSRSVIAYGKTRGGREGTYPDRVLNGPFVVLVNQFSGSDGDIFPQAIQLAGLGPLIGTRSWGGVVGINSIRPLVDGGLITQPGSAWWDPRDGWRLENRGVIPDIELVNQPQELANGIDAQLDRAIEEVLQLHRENPPGKPDFGPVPDRTRKGRSDELKQ